MEPSKESIQAVLFDLDDTLYDREAVFRRWGEAFVRDWLQLETDEERREALLLIASLDTDGYGSKQTIFFQLPDFFPILGADRGAVADRCFDEFLTHITLEHQVDSVLAALKEASLPFGVITNGSSRQWRKIERLGLRERTPCLFVSETFGVRKPDSAIFLAAADCLGVPPGCILFVGDNPANDIAGARAVGMKTAWLHRGKPWPQALAHVTPDFTISRLEEMIPCLSHPALPCPSPDSSPA